MATRKDDSYVDAKSSHAQRSEFFAPVIQCLVYLGASCRTSCNSHQGGICIPQPIEPFSQGAQVLCLKSGLKPSFAIVFFQPSTTPIQSRVTEDQNKAWPDEWLLLRSLIFSSDHQVLVRAIGPVTVSTKLRTSVATRARQDNASWRSH